MAVWVEELHCHLYPPSDENNRMPENNKKLKAIRTGVIYYHWNLLQNTYWPTVLTRVSLPHGLL